MEDQTKASQVASQSASQPKNRWWLWLVIIIVVVGAVIFVYFGYWRFNSSNSTNLSNSSNWTNNISTTTNTGQKIEIPEKILANKFGWLSAGPDDGQNISEMGGAWVRPHPAPFLWDSMQKSADGEISYKYADEQVEHYQKNNIAILATIWPFAEWDQLNRSDAKNCEVSSEDEFLPKSRSDKMDKVFGKDADDAMQTSYLPLHRCNPSDWTAYAKWLTAIVERYDGDGQSDMSGLKMPIKYWEVTNEPDLESLDGRLDFYQEGATAYAQLLVETSKTIRIADPDAKILIAGAAGGNSHFLDFYRQVFKELKQKEFIAQTSDIYSEEAIFRMNSVFDIGNVHCISNDNFDSFNVEPYQALLKEFNLEKSIWVTEAEAMVSADSDEVATQVYDSTKKALSLGAERIFYTMYDFQNRPGSNLPPKNLKPIEINPQLKGKSATEAYQIITSQ